MNFKQAIEKAENNLNAGSNFLEECESPELITASALLGIGYALLALAKTDRSGIQRVQVINK
jgi:hypothetical protein